MLLSPCAPAAPAMGAATMQAPAQLTPYEVLARAQSVKYYADRALWEVRDNEFGPGRFRKLLAAAVASYAQAAQEQAAGLALLAEAAEGHAARVLSAAEQAFSGAQAPAQVQAPEIVCVVCQEGRDALGQCRCCYVPAPQLLAHAA